MSEVYYFSEWSKGIACMGPPTSMYVIGAEDVGPVSFEWAKTEAIPEVCGYTSIPVIEGCCMGSYDVDSSVSESMMLSSIVEPTSGELVRWTPNTAIGSKYCTVTYTVESGNSLTKYLLDDGVCRESWQCDKGVLKVSNSTQECMGNFQEAIVDGQFSELLNSSVTYSTTTITQGTQAKVWLGFYPFSRNIIYITTPGIWFSVFLIALGMSSSIFGSIYILWQMRLHPNRSAIYLPSLFCQFAGIAGSAVFYQYYFVTQSGDEEFRLLNQFCSLLQALTSFLVIYNNIASLVYIFKGTKYTEFLKGREYILYGSLVFVHLALSWPWYVAYWLYDYPLLNLWFGYGTIWFGISLLGNWLALVALIYYQLTKGTDKSKPSYSEMFSELVFNNTGSFVLLLVLIFNLIWFLVCYWLLNLGLYLQNDNDYQVFQTFIWLPIPIDGFIYVWLFDKGFSLTNISWCNEKCAIWERPIRQIATVNPLVIVQ